MKKQFMLFILLCFVTVGLFAQGSTHIHKTLEYDSITRKYMVYVPQSYNPETPAPVVMALHCLADSIEARFFTAVGFDRIADRTGWIIVTPQALNATLTLMGSTNDFGTAWAAGVGAEDITVQGYPVGDINLNGDVDDLGFLTTLLDTIERQYNVNTDSIFFVGYSMGGFMANKMGIALSDRIAGIASVSGTIGYWEMDKTPKANLNTIHFHGTDDELIRYSDGWLTYFMPLAKVATSAPETIDYWRNFNQCDAEPTITYFPNASGDAQAFERYLYTNGTNDSRSALVRVIGGEHEWYTAPQHDIDYATEIYKFFTNTYGLS